MRLLEPAAVAPSRLAKQMSSIGQDPCVVELRGLSLSNPLNSIH